LSQILSASSAAQGIYLLGSGAWRVVDVVPVEEDLEVPVVQPATGRIVVVAAVVDKTLRHSLFIRRIRNPPADPADTTALEREIDQQVYALYGLTPEEIQIVDDATK
jgi:hypothetical protein